MILIVLAGLNMAFFNAITSRTLQSWDELSLPPKAAKIRRPVFAGALDLHHFLRPLDRFHTGPFRLTWKRRRETDFSARALRIPRWHATE
jgi:hypothetical protein